MPVIPAPYLLFLGDAKLETDAKTASGIAYWRPNDCLAQYRLPSGTVDLGLANMSPEDAAAAGARTLVIGLAPLGGAVEQSWIDVIVRAMKAGLDVASGLHTRLADIPLLAAAAAETGRTIFDVRAPTETFETLNHYRRTGLRLLTVGTDCAVGKKYTALAIERELHSRGRDATFRATGQTGILISGRGVVVDAVVSDFLAGAAATLSPDAAPDHWDIVEGQGSLFHPSYAGVSLGLLHGSQPDAIILCHDAARTANGDFADLPLPSLEACAALNLQHAQLVNPNPQLAGVSLNTKALSESDARQLIDDTARRMGVPVVDPVRFGVAPIVDLMLARWPAHG